METKNFTIERANSKIEWTGKKVTGAHNGTVDIANGTLSFADGKLSGGQVTIATDSIKILDVTDPGTNAQFAGHLASDDFFSTAKYPTASLVITKVTPESDTMYHVAGDLTIKGITHPIEFDAEIANVEGDTLQASGILVIDRTLYDMKFRSGNFFKNLGDNLIYNDFVLDIRLSAKAA